jgi:hypothetical protein
MEIKLLPVLISVIANFFLGFIWYTPLFGKIWAREMGFDTNMKPSAGQMAKSMILMIIGNFFMAYVFAHNIEAWGFVPDMKEMPAGAQIGNAVLFTWLGFYLPVDLNTVAWEGKSWKLFAINTSFHFLMLLVAAVLYYFI